MALKIRLRSERQAVKEKINKGLKDSKPIRNPLRIAKKTVKKA